MIWIQKLQNSLKMQQHIVDGEYQLTNKITDQNIHDMRANMDETDAVEFDKFIEKYWGKTKKV